MNQYLQTVESYLYEAQKSRHVHVHASLWQHYLLVSKYLSAESLLYFQLHFTFYTRVNLQEATLKRHKWQNIKQQKWSALMWEPPLLDITRHYMFLCYKFLMHQQSFFVSVLWPCVCTVLSAGTSERTHTFGTFPGNYVTPVWLPHSLLANIQWDWWA